MNTVIAGNLVPSILFIILGILMALVGISNFFQKDADPGSAFFPVIITLMCFIPSFVLINRDVSYSYIPPTSIIKTNDTTTVLYIAENGKKYVDLTNDEAKYWNSTNITIKVTEGRNLWGNKLNRKMYLVCVQ
jgi:hypothetical protein